MSLVLLLALLGCKQAEPQIAPLTSATFENNETPALESITLPTPQIQNASNGYYQDDNGLRVAIAAVGTRAIPPSNKDERGSHYLVLTLALTNLSNDSKDVTGFPFAIWIQDAANNEEYMPQLYAPSEISLWQAIDQLNKGTVKTLGKHQTVRGQLFFQVPVSASKFNLIWQPSPQRQWILSIPNLGQR